MTRALDLLLSAILLGAGSVAVIVLGCVLRPLVRRQPARSSGQTGRPRRIVYLGTGQIAQVFPRNGVNLFLKRECSDFGGYFEQMWNVHFPAGSRGRLDLTPRHHLIDVDFPSADGQFRLTAVLSREVRFLLWLVPFLVRSRASVVTATNPYLQGVNAAIAARLLGLPYAVIITRDYDWDWLVLGKQAFRSVYPARRLERAVGRWVLRNADLVLADRRYYRDFAVRNGARPGRAIATRVLADSAFADAAAAANWAVADSAVAAAVGAVADSAVADPAVAAGAVANAAVVDAAAAGSASGASTTQPGLRARYALGAGPLLTYVGRLDPDKFPLDLVDCLALVRRRFPDAVLACAGTGGSSEAMQARATELGVANGLRLLGALPLDELPCLLAQSDVAVAAHMGYTLVEAGLSGTPIVTYDYDFHAEIITDGETGYLAQLRDVATLADRVCCVLENREHARAMGQRLREQLLREHSLEAVVPLYRQAYDLVLGATDA